MAGLLCATGWAQSLTTGALSGVVKDPSGEAIPGAAVTLTNAATGASHTTQTQINGSYLVPLLQPGSYTVTVAKAGFKTAKQSGVAIAVSTNATLNFQLTLGAATQTVEVTGQPPLIQPQNANTTTTLNAKAIANLPNPGNDITMLAQISPGAVMHVQGGGGTAGLSFNGVQGNAVEYTYDGMDDNDPFNNDNNSGPSNMLLGQNSVAEVTVNTNAYDVNQGRMAGGQVNYTTKSGTDNFHGDLQWQWNGRALNAHDFFDKSTPLAPGQSVVNKPFDNVNNWAASIGGPIVKHKLFFFFDNEGTRIDLPISRTFLVPTPAFESYAQQQLLLGGYDTNAALASGGHYRYLPAQPGEAAWLQDFFKLYGNTAVGTRNQSAISPDTKKFFGCNLLANGTVDPNYVPQNNPTAAGGANPIPSDTGCVNQGIFEGTAHTPETLTDFRIDYDMTANDTVWGKYLDDQGLQTTGINPVNPLFNESSFQPDHQGVLDWTHVFTPTLTNDASTGFLWYSAIFNFVSPAAEHAAIGGLGALLSPFQALGSTVFPLGRNVTQYQFIDNLSWVKGTHSFEFGENFRREIVNDHFLGRNSYASSQAGNFSEVMYGAASSAQLAFPVATEEQFRDFSLDVYAGDTWQIAPTLTLTYGIRATHNSNAVDKQPYLSNFADFSTFTHANLNGGNLATPPSAVFTAASQLWNSVPFAVWQPRAALAWQPRSSTLVKVGWGMFSQVAAASAAETLARNPPFDPLFTGGFGPGNLGANGSPAGCTQNGGSDPQCGTLWDPTAPGSAVAATIAANAAFQKNFASGQPSCAYTGPSLTCVPQAAIAALPANGLTPQVTYQYNFTVQQQIGRNMSFSAGYVGSRSQHLAYVVGDNGYQRLCAGCFAPFLYSATGAAGAPDPRFTSYSQTRYNGYSRYDSLQTTFIDRMSRGLTLNFNYTWSHCLSTGTPYLDGAPLSNTYVDCTDDITNVANAAYTYQLPIHAGNGLLGDLFNHWQISGATFAEGGTPLFSLMDGGAGLGGILVNTTGPKTGYLGSAGVYSKDVAISGITQNGTVQWLNPAALYTAYDPTTRQCFAPGSSNPATEAVNPANCQFTGNNGGIARGPAFNWTNFDVAKMVQLTERVGLRLDFQAYNLFNHPNFSNPNTTAAGGIAADMSGSDAISGPLTAPNNSLLGQNGGDAGPRMLAFQAKLSF